MPTQNTPADQVFAYLAKTLDFQSGFGLCYLFSDDIVGLGWLRQRIEEHIRTESELRETADLKVFDNFEQLGASIMAMCESSSKRTLAWCLLPSSAQTCQAVLQRMNEQRQRMLASKNFFILVVPKAFEHDAPAWAPDLWSVRKLTYQWQRSGGRVSESFNTSWNKAPQASSTDPSHTTVAMQTWQRIYKAWTANPAASKPAPEVGLLASEQAKKLGQFALAVQFAEESLLVADANNLSRANALKALGDLKSRLGQVAQAQALYEQAIALYEKEQADLGLGYAWAELASLWARDVAAHSQAADAAKKAWGSICKAGSPPAKAQVGVLLAAAGFTKFGDEPALLSIAT